MGSQRPFVCIVDDDLSILSALGRLLRAADFEVSTFESGKAFVESVAIRRPGCVILDIHMPLMDGFAVRDEIRAFDATIPIVFVTAHDGELIDRRVAESDGCMLLRKPFGADRLIDAIVDAMTESNLTHRVNGYE